MHPPSKNRPGLVSAKHYTNLFASNNSIMTQAGRCLDSVAWLKQPKMLILKEQIPISREFEQNNDVQGSTVFGNQMANPANDTNHQKGGTTPVPISQPKSSGEGQTDLSLIIGCVCVVGLVLVVSIFVFVLCRMCHSGSRGNRALLGKVPMERGSDAGDCSGSNSNSGRKTKALDANNGMVSGGGGGDGRFMTFGGPGAFCLANTMASGEIPSPSIPVDMYSAFNGNDGMLQTLHLMQQQHQKQQTVSGYDSTLRPLLQNFSAAGFATLGPSGAPPSMFQVPPPPPPPDQPLPPLPPITPTSGTSGTQQHHQRPSSTINPYAASSAVSIFANGGNGTTMITSTHTGIGINQVARIVKTK
ncbi:hypothetical protein ACTXT7_009048 [Hymenolepis weldensis]